MRLFPLAAVVGLLLPLPAAATWRQATSAAFIVYSRGSEADLRTKVRQLAQFDELLHLLTGIQATKGMPPLPVYFVTGRDLRTFGIDSSTVGGFYRSTLGGIMAALAVDRAREGFGNGVLSVLFHEYTHHFMFANTNGSYPGWYVEGFAEYLMPTQLRESYIEYGDSDPGRAYQLINRPWLPMRRVLSLRGGELRDPDDVSAYYAESWLAVHYLSRDPDRAKSLHAYLQALAHGTKPEAAFTGAFGFGYNEMDRRLQAYLRSGHITKSRITGLKLVADTDVTVTVLPPAADTLLVPATQLQQLPFARSETDPSDAATAKASAAERAELLATIRRGAARFPGDAFAAAALAEAEVKIGDRAAGIRQLDALLAKTPGDAQLLYLRGQTGIADAYAGPPDLRAAGMKQARLLLAHANLARPDDFRILAAHARTYPLDDFPDKEVAVLLRAADLAPQVGAVQMQAAIMLARRGDKNGAKQRLTPIANNPHGGGEAAAAAALIAAIDNGTPFQGIKVTERPS